MHFFLLCSMVVTLCVDVGWKPLKNLENKEGIEQNAKGFVIQIPPEQYRQMIKNGNAVSFGIPNGVSKVWIQLGTETLEPLDINAFTPRPETETPPPTSETITPGTRTSETGASASEIVPTSHNTPLVNTPPLTLQPAQETAPPTPTPSPAKKTMEPKEESRNASSPTEKSDSYLATAIVSWVISAGLFALVLYLAWIHLEVRNRYQALLNKTMPNRTAEPPATPQPATTPPPASRAPSTPSIAPDPPRQEKPETKTPPIPSSASTPIPGTEISQAVSPVEEPPQTSTPIESGIAEAEAFSVTLDPQADANSETDSGLHDTDDSDMDATERLLQNTNRAMTQATEHKITASQESRDHSETIFGLPETLDQEPLENDEENDKNREGIE